MKLWDRLRNHLRSAAPAPSDEELEVRVATAILLLEAAHGDEEYDWHEHRAIVRGLDRSFGIGRQEARRLLGLAEPIRPPVVSLADVTAVIADRCSPAQRRRIARLVWQVVRADHQVLDWEAAFASHVARAVGLTPEEAEEARREGSH